MNWMHKSRLGLLFVGLFIVSSGAVLAKEAEPDQASQSKVSDASKRETIDLAKESLVTGIPGKGVLTLAELKKWLADEKNHRVLDVELPLGLSAGQDQIVGLKENPLTRAKIELGRQLYFDKRLSADGSISCASCHDPSEGYAKHTQFGVGIRDQQGDRNSPTAYNRILSGKQFWDGRAKNLEAQAVGPIENPIEMGNTHEACVKTLAQIPGYKLQFEKIFSTGVTIDNVGRALASFERVLVTGPSPFDYAERLAGLEKAYQVDLEDIAEFKEEDPEAYEEIVMLRETLKKKTISRSALRGGKLFFSDQAKCTACHVGANYTDELYHNLGVGMQGAAPDLGREKTTQDLKDRGAFKTPTIRNVAQTAPYMHDGSQKTLAEVVEWYAKGGHPNSNLSEKVEKLKLSAQDKADLVAFMKSLTGELPEVEQTRLPE